MYERHRVDAKWRQKRFLALPGGCRMASEALPDAIRHLPYCFSSKGNRYPALAGWRLKCL